jgi:hypothetical protein
MKWQFFIQPKKNLGDLRETGDADSQFSLLWCWIEETGYTIEQRSCISGRLICINGRIFALQNVVNQALRLNGIETIYRLETSEWGIRLEQKQGKAMAMKQKMSEKRCFTRREIGTEGKSVDI